MTTIKLETYVDYWMSRIRHELDKESVAIIEKFDEELKAADYANNTRKGYLASLYQFLTFVKKPIPHINKEDMTLFLNHLTSLNKKSSTRKNYNRRLARFFKWYNEELDLYVDFAKSTKEFQLPDWSEKLPTMDEIEKMLAVCTHPRDKALFSILVESGARIGEILRMTYTDVKVNDVYIRISVRGRKTKRDIPIVWAAKYLMQWIDLHPTKKPSDPLWPHKSHYTTQKIIHINYQAAFLIIKKLKERANIERKINPKLFRHLRATILAKDPRISTQVKKALLGHSPTSTIFETTYQHLSQDDVVELVLKSYGLQEDEQLEYIPELKNELCPRCNAAITKNDKYCSQCWFVIDQAEALKQQEELKLLRQELEDMRTNYSEIIELKNKLKEKLLG